MFNGGGGGGGGGACCFLKSISVVILPHVHHQKGADSVRTD
jgi:hypothetical protein